MITNQVDNTIITIKTSFDLPPKLLSLLNKRRFAILFEEYQVLHPKLCVTDIYDIIKTIKSKFFSTFDTSLRDDAVKILQQTLPEAFHNALANNLDVNQVWNSISKKNILAVSTNQELELYQKLTQMGNVVLRFSLVPNVLARLPPSCHPGDRMIWTQKQNLGSFFVSIPLLLVDHGCWIRSYFMNDAVSGLDVEFNESIVQSISGGENPMENVPLSLMHGLCSSIDDFSSSIGVVGTNSVSKGEEVKEEDKQQTYKSNSGAQFVFVADGNFNNLPESCKGVVHINGNEEAPLPIDCIYALNVPILMCEEESNSNSSAFMTSTMPSNLEIKRLFDDMIQIKRLRSHKGTPRNTTIHTWRTNGCIRGEGNGDQRHEFLYDNQLWDNEICQILPKSILNILNVLIKYGANRIRIQLQLHSNDSLIIQKHCNNDGVAFFDHVEHYDVPRGLEYQDRICTGFCVLLPEGERQKYWKRVRSCADDD